VRGWFTLTTAQVDASPIGQFASLLVGGFAKDLRYRPDAGGVYLYWRDRDVAHSSDVDAPVA